MNNEFLKIEYFKKFQELDHGFGSIHTVYPEDIILMKQRHTNTVFIVDSPNLNYLPVADAMLTNMKNVKLGVKTADCLPILLYNPESVLIGVIHSGWRGIVNRVISNTIDLLKNFYNARPEHTYLAIGPSIGSCCYEVGRDVYESISSTMDTGDAFKEKTKQKWLLNLRKMAGYEITSNGVPESNIFNIDICTRCSDDFYSYRAGKEGRQISYITLVS